MVDERFAFLTAPDGRKFQVLQLDPETGEPTNWDETATNELYRREVPE